VQWSLNPSRDFRLPPQCKLDLPLLGFYTAYIRSFKDVSVQTIGPIFKRQTAMDCLTFNDGTGRCRYHITNLRNEHPARTNIS